MAGKGFVIVGRRKGKRYRSRPHRTEAAALKAAYGMVYMKNGFTKRKNQLSDFSIEPA